MRCHLYDVIIAGAGPAGLHAAACCEDRGLDVLVLEEHPCIGKPGHCSGLVSSNLESFVPVRKEFVQHEVRGAVLHSPGGGELRLEKRGTAAYVISRPRFDRYLASKIKSRLLLSSCVDSFDVRKDHVMVRSGKNVFLSRSLLGCDGANSSVRKGMGVRPKKILSGIIAIKKGRDFSEHVHVWYDKGACDGYLWRIPRGRSTEFGMLGSAGSDVGFKGLEDFFGIRGKYERFGGAVPLGPPRTCFDRVLLVGDAAAQAKPWSGGGVIYSLMAAEMASDALRDAKAASDFSRHSLIRYEKAWKAGIGRRIRAGMVAASAYKKMSNSQIDFAIRHAGRVRFLMNKMDMDFLVR